MSVICLLIGVSLAIALGFLLGFIWAVRSGQYDDPVTPSLRLLTEEPTPTDLHASPGRPTEPHPS